MHIELLIENLKNKIMKMQLIDSIDFSKEEYNQKTENGDYASFDEFIESILKTVEENNGTLEDAVYIANDAFRMFN